MFALTTFLSAFLLFQVQPLLSKAILPWFGGSPAVWTVCMLFFQVTLFGGYVYAHLITKHLPKTGQAALHILLLGIAVSLGPITPAASWKPGPTDDPTARILMLLAVCVGLPYFVLSATGPLLQAWFARTKPGVSPYRLYALSNGGSLIALLSYPFAFEPAFDIARQGQLWSWGFVAFAVCCAVCAIANAVSKTEAVAADVVRTEPEAEPTVPTRADWSLWIALPMTACVLLIAATNQICQEVAVIPFLWVVPLALYLLSFILTFDSSRWYRRIFWYSGLIVSAAASVWLMLSGGQAPMLQQLSANFAMLFCGCMVCHGELVRMKPHPRYLTSFYLCLSAGGALGGMFVGLLAQRLFTGYFEWHLAILATCLLPLIVFVRDASSPLYRGRSPWGWTVLVSLLSMISIGLTMHLRKITEYRTDATRNFFGVLKIEVFSDIVTMKHGGVLHGMQWRDPEKRRIGTSYYSEDSGVGLILKQCRPDRPLKVGLVGLGAGTTAVYGREGDHFRFYEINPEVLRLAKKYFSYLADCPAKVDVVLGDARLQLEQEPPQEYDVLVLDAFSGDGVPVHLLTSEAFDIYRKHLQPNGVIAAHVSNRHLDLRPVLNAQAERLALQTLSIVKRRDEAGASDNAWVLLTDDSTLFARDELKKRQIKDDGRKVLWTDARSDLMAILAKRQQPSRPMTEPLNLADESSLLRALRASPALLNAIAQADATESEFHLQQRLRRESPDELVRAALTLRDLRRKAVVSEKFSRAEQMWFTPTGLEQATAEPIARHKAKRFDGLVWDFCCGIGGDSLALAERCDVHAVDRDPAMCLRTEWNAEAYGVGEQVRTIAEDVTRLSERDGLLHIDPDRRPDGRQRLLRVEDCSPGLDVLRVLMSEFRGGAIKLSPASNFGGKFSGAEIELVSLHGECKEATVWFGDLAGEQSFRATSLPAGETIAADPLSARAEVTPPRAFVFDPDPAIVRAGLVDVLAEQRQLTRLDDAEEYLTGDELLVSPWVQPFQVLDVLPNNDREVRAACRRFEFASVEIKCRHLPIDVERTRHKLPLEGNRPGVLIFARLAGKAQVIVATRNLERT